MSGLSIRVYEMKPRVLSMSCRRSGGVGGPASRDLHPRRVTGAAVISIHSSAAVSPPGASLSLFGQGHDLQNTLSVRAKSS